MAGRRSSTPLVALAALACVVACQRATPAEERAARSIEHLSQAVAMLDKHAPDMIALTNAVMHYRLAHQGEFTRLRGEGEALLAAMTAAERKQFEDTMRARVGPLQVRLEAAAQRYRDPKMAMRLVRPLLVAASPRPPPPGQPPPWLPPLPAGVSETDLPPSRVHMHDHRPGDDHDHDHEHAPASQAPRGTGP